MTWTVLRNDLVPNALPAQELWYAEQPLQVSCLAPAELQPTYYAERSGL